MKNGKQGVVSEIMMGSPVTLKPDDTLDLANDVISWVASAIFRSLRMEDLWA
jgi:hypothetical protein